MVDAKVTDLFGAPSPTVAPAPGGLLIAHGVTCPQCQFAHCALWGFAPLGTLPPNAICPACGYKWALPRSFHDALSEASRTPRIAALLDADNIEAHTLAELREWFEERGQLLVFRAYGNRNTFNGPTWDDALMAGLDLVVTEVRPQAADMTIAVDLGVLASSRQYHELFVISGDRALSIAAEHVASSFGERQLVYCGQPHAVVHHTSQCRLGIKHARVEELIGLLQLMLFEREGREKCDVLHRALIDTVPWFHPRIYNQPSFLQFLAEHFPVERAADGSHFVSLPEGEEDELSKAASAEEVLPLAAALPDSARHHPHEHHGHRRHRRHAR